MHTQHSQIQAMVFDFDGTLATLTIDFDLMRRQVAAVAGAFFDDTAGFDGDDQGGKRLPILEWVDHMAGLLETREDRDTALEFHTRCRFVILDMELKAAREGRLFDFTKPMLADLRTRGVATAVITRNSNPAVKTVFPEIEDGVDVLLSREAVARVKPDPLHLRTALENLGVDPAHALMVGDHPMDVETGHRAGTRSAGVTSGRMTAEDLAAQKPDFLAEHCAQLLQQLDANDLLPHSTPL